ncbi:MAG: sugar ABC transporter substrate-binding protein, partial [Chloroflexota bacterium]
MKRFSFVVLVMVVLCSVFIAPLAAQDAVTLQMWSRDSNQDFLRELVDMWNESHTNQIELTIIPAADFVTRVG